MSMELSLGLFTTLMQIAVGLSFCLSLAQISTEDSNKSFKNAWLIVTVVGAIGLLISLFHLGRPFSAISAIKHVGTSWLSREVIIVSIFIALSFLSYYTKANKNLAIVTLVSAILALIAQGFTYAEIGFPAIDNIYPLLWFSLAALASGITLFVFLGYNEKDTVLASFAPYCLAVFIISLVLLPFTWLNSDQAVIKQTASNWFASPIFWLGISSLAAATAMAFTKKNAKVVFALCVLGVFTTRLVFFMSTVHTATNIGNKF